MTAHFTIPASREEADRVRTARGFSSFKEWEKNQRQAIATNKARGRTELVEALEREFYRYIKPNL
jgi:hypothetical protein